MRIADGLVEVWDSRDRFLAGADPGRQRTWFQTRVDEVKVVQTTSNGVNLTVKISRLGRDGRTLSSDEGVFLVVLRDGTWKVQARSMIGTSPPAAIIRLMLFPPSEHASTLALRLSAFMAEHIYPNERLFQQQVAEGDRWQPPRSIEKLKAKARAAGLWNLFLPDSEHGAGLTNLEYAPLCEIMGRVALRARRCSTARRPTPATWKCWRATAPTQQRSSGSSRCWPARSARASR